MAGIGDFFFGSEGTPGEHGIDISYIDEYDDYAGIRGDLIDYYSGILQGREPQFFQEYLPQIEQQQEQALNRYYLGDPGNRQTSAMGLAGQTGSMAGVGPKGTVAQQGKVNYELQAKKAAAKAAMNKYRADWMGQAQFKSTEGLQRLPRNPAYESASYQIQPQAGTEGFLSKFAGTVGSQFAGGVMDNAFSEGGWFGGLGKNATGNTNLGGGNTLSDYNASSNAASNAGYGSDWTSQYR